MTQNFSNESRPPRPRRIRGSQAQNPPPVDGQVSSLPTTVSQQPEIAEQPPKTKKRGRPRKTTAAVSPIHSQPVIPQQPAEQPAEQLAEQPVDSQVSPPAVESAEQVVSSPPEEGQLPPAQEESSAPVLVVDQPEVLPPDSGQPLVVKQNVNINKIFPVKKKSFPLFPYSAMRIFDKTIEKRNKIEFQIDI